MREVVVLNDYATVNGGSSAVAIASARGLAERGCAVTYFSCVGPVAEELRGVPGLEAICLGQEEIVKDPNRLRAFVRGVRNGPAIARLEEVLRGKDPRQTIVHVHTWMKALSPFAVHAAVRLGFPVVLTMHDFFTTCPTGSYFVHGPNELCHRQPLSWDCVSCRCDRRQYAHKLWRSARTFVQNKVLRVPEGVRRFIGVSEFSARILQRHLPARARVSLVRNPADCASTPPARVAENAPYVFIGRFAPEKGPLVFAEAVQRSGLPAVFIGDGDLAAAARARCPQAQFTGWLSAPEVRGWLQRARALVFPPLWYETLGLVVVEAAAHGVPAIVADECAASEVVQHGVTGLHFRRGDAGSLAEQMARLQEAETVAAMGRRAYDWYWRDPWTTARHVEDLLKVYEEVLA